MARFVLILVATMVGGVSQLGCASQQAPEPALAYLFDAADYADVFQAAKDVLREYQFELDRVDARMGVITTASKPSAGLATPWIPHSGSVGGSIEGLLQHEQRRASVRFALTDPNDAQAQEDVDFRRHEGELVARIDVVVERIHRPHRRVSPVSIKLGSFAHDTGPVRTGGAVQREHLIQSQPDEALGQRMLRSLVRKIDAHSAKKAQ